MIVTRTPLRISFLGGGTDLASFYQRDGGAVVSMAFNRYIHLCVHRGFEPRYILKYSTTEMVEHLDDIQHPLFRECIRASNLDGYVEVASFADIPSRGSGLGSSSAFAVGLVKALLELEHRENSPETCADLACRIEIDRLGEPIGKQDQYAAAYGGLSFIQFHPDGSVSVEPLRLNDAAREELENQLVMVYTGQTRAASSVLSDQKRNTETDPATFDRLRRLRDMAGECRELIREERIDELGPLLHRGWLEKKRLSGGITSGAIDHLYEAGLAAGATGGKLLGAGGGGFFLFLCPPERRRALLQALGQPRVFYPRLEPRGSQVVYGA